MTDREAFIAAIVATPAADLPRLVFADWLDEHDEPALAEFVRAHVRLYHLRPGTAEHAAVARRVKELFLANHREWVGPFCEMFGRKIHFDPKSGALTRLGRSLLRVPDWVLHEHPYRFEGRDIVCSFADEQCFRAASSTEPPPELERFAIARGLIEKIAVTFHERNDCTHLSDSFRSHPITTCEMLFSGADLNGLDGPHLARIVQAGMHFFARHGTADTMSSRVFQSSHLTELRTLILRQSMHGTYGGYIADPVILSLARSPLTTRLKVLRVVLEAEALIALAEYPITSPLEELCTVGITEMNAADWALLPAIPLRETLRRLSLKSCRLTDDAVLAITRVRRWDKLTHLRLDDNTLADRGVAGMCRSCVFPEVRFLNLARNRIGDAGAVAIARSGLAQTVRFLDLTDNPVTATGAVPLAAALAEGPLQLLKLSARPLGRRTARRVSEMLGNRVRFA